MYLFSRVPWRHAVAAFVLALGLVSWQATRDGVEMPVADAVSYLTIANNLHTYGVFGDGSTGDQWDSDEPGRFTGPLYPAFVATLMSVDATFATTVRCVIDAMRTPGAPACPPEFGIAIGAQVAVVALGLVAAWVAGWLLIGSLSGAWLTMLLAASAREYLMYAGSFLTEVLYLPLMAWATVAIVAWIQRGTARYAVAAGALLALAILSRPGALYLGYAVIVAGMAAAVLAPAGRRGARALGVAAFAAGLLAVLAPWMIRNVLHFGDPALTAGYAHFILVQRVAYNLMSWPEWAVSFVYWFPDIGDNLAHDLFDPALYERLSFFTPDGYYLLGNGVLRQELNVLIAQGVDPMRHLLSEGILAQPVKHVAVTLSLAWRGMFIEKWWGVIGLILLIPVTVRMIRARRYDFLAFLAMPFFMVGLNAFVSVSVPRYNLPLVPLIAVGVAVLLLGWAGAARHRVRKWRQPAVES